jgi:signal transduction histidine kinase
VTISVKLLGSILLIFVVAFGSLAYLVDRDATSVLLMQASRRLEVVRRSRAQALTTYFTRVHDGLSATESLTPQLLLEGMPDALRALPRELASDLPDRRRRLIDFYRTTIQPRMEQAGIDWPSAEEYVSRMSPEAIAVQSEYTIRPGDEAGPAAGAASTSRRTAYDNLYARYHAIVDGFARSLNCRDVMLVAPDATVVYSVRKDIELGTNLRSGIFRTTPLATAFERAITAEARGRRFVIDYAPYQPAFGAPMVFMSAPAFVVGREALLGAIILEVAAADVDLVLTERSGLEPTEEVYAVGPDFRLRSSSRFHAEPTILSLRVDTEAAHRALAGESGTIQQHDYRNTPVLASFAPLELPGVRWALLSEIDLEQVVIPARALRVRILILFVGLGAVGSALLVVVLRRVVLVPIRTLTDAARRIDRGDFDRPVDLATNDELGHLARVVDTMMRSIRTSLEEARLRLAESQVDLRQVAARLNDVREHERARLARDVHDRIGQALTALRMDVAEVRRRVDRSDSVGAEARLDEMSTLIDESIDESRRIASELRLAAMDDVGPIEAMRGYVMDYSRRSGIPIRFDARVAAGGPPLSNDRAAALFRILQEALTNVVRHAEAHNVDVRLTIAIGEVSLVVRDDGRGVPAPEHRRHGLGLVGMRDRALLFGGDVVIAAGPGGGTTVTASLPLTERP